MNDGENRMNADLKKNIKILTQMLFVLFGSIVLGLLLLTLVFLLPDDRVFYNFSTSVGALERFDVNYNQIYDYDGSKLDTFTEALMLKAASTPQPPTGENVFQRAMRVYILEGREAQHGLKFYEYDWNGKSYSCDSYERYWHGYLVFLRPLLYVFTYQDILYINIVLQLVLIFFLLYQVQKRLREYLIPFAALFILCLPVSILLCLDYSICFYIYILSSLLIIIYNKKVEKYYMFMFLVIGIITVYMDFLTWPLITLGIPLMVFFIVATKENILKRTLICGVSWGFGYLGMWAGKWICASLILGDNIILDALNQIGLRVSNEDVDNHFNAIDAIGKNLGMYGKKTILMMLFLCICWSLLQLRKGMTKIKVQEMLSVCIIMLMPFAWYIILTNHSYLHPYMTWRILNISLFAMMCGCAYISNRRNPAINK